MQLTPSMLNSEQHVQLYQMQSLVSFIKLRTRLPDIYSFIIINNKMRGSEGRSLSAAPLALGKLYETLSGTEAAWFQLFHAAVFVGQLVSFVTELLDFCSVTVTGA